MVSDIKENKNKVHKRSILPERMKLAFCLQFLIFDSWFESGGDMNYFRQKF